MGPTLFNIYLADLFMFSMNSTIANYADDNTPYTTAKDIESIIYNLEIDSSTLPNMNTSQFNDNKLNELLGKLSHEMNKKVYIAGDFNFDLLKTSTHTDTTLFYEKLTYIFLSLPYLPKLIIKLTRLLIIFSLINSILIPYRETLL